MPVVSITILLKDTFSLQQIAQFSQIAPFSLESYRFITATASVGQAIEPNAGECTNADCTVSRTIFLKFSGEWLTEPPPMQSILPLNLGLRPRFGLRPQFCPNPNFLATSLDTPSPSPKHTIHTTGCGPVPRYIFTTTAQARFVLERKKFIFKFGQFNK